jgi:hypothetical protein
MSHNNIGKIKGITAIAALVCGVLGLLIFVANNTAGFSLALGEALFRIGVLLFLLAIVLGVVSLILGAVSPKTSPRNHEITIAGAVSPNTSPRNRDRSRDIALVGIILGAGFFVLFVLALIYFFFVLLPRGG